jgi:hypothetical protein
LDLETELVNWISTHRHSQQEIYFLSQHTDQFARQVLGIADSLFEIVNLKSLTLPFPISISMQDFYELRKAFGIKTQYYQANPGNFRGKAIRWSGAADRHLMSTEIYGVYKSHASDVVESDRPDLGKTKWEAVKWFTGKHGWHLIPKIVFAVSLPFLVMYTIIALPSILVGAASGGTPVANDPPEPPAITKTETPPPPPAERPSNIPRTDTIQPETPPLPAPVTPAIPVERVKFSMLFNGGIILDDGRKIAIGETMGYAGETETLAAACAVCGIIIFESGKRIRF